MNETVKNRRIRKIYWAITENRPSPESGSLKHFLVRDGRTNRTKAYDRPVPDAKEARLDYRLLAESDRYRLLEIELLTGRHHQIRAQLSKIGCPIRGDLKYGAPRSNRDGSISLHARSIEFVHPVRRSPVLITAPVPPQDNLWKYFEQTRRAATVLQHRRKRLVRSCPAMRAKQDIPGLAARPNGDREQIFCGTVRRSP